MVPLLVPEVVLPLDLSIQAHVFFRDKWYHPYISTCFCEKFLLPFVHRTCVVCALCTVGLLPETAFKVIMYSIILSIFAAAVLDSHTDMMPAVQCLAVTSVLLQKVAV